MAKRAVLIDVLGDFKSYISGSKSAATATGTLDAGVAKLGRTILSTYTAKKVIDFGTAAVKAAVDDAAAQTILAKSLKNSTGATDEQIASVENWIDKTQRQVGIADDQLRPALDTLVRSTKDVTKAQDLLSLAMDVSRGTGKDLETVSAAIAKAYAGNTTALTKLVPGLKSAGEKTIDFATAQERLNTQFEGQAEAFANTDAGKLERMQVTFGELQEQIGSALLPALSKVVSVIGAVMDWFNGLDSSTQNVIITVGLVAAGLYVAVTAINAVSVAASSLGITIGSVMPWLLAIGVAIGAVIAATAAFSDEEDQSAKATKAYSDSLKQSASAVDLQTIAVLSAVDAQRQYGKSIYADVEKKARDGVAASTAMTDAMNALDIKMSDVTLASHDQAKAQELRAKISKYATDNDIDMGEALLDLADGSTSVNAGLAGLNAVLASNATAAENSTEQNLALARAGDVTSISILKQQGALDLLTPAEQAAAEAALDAAAKAGNLASAQDALGVILDGTTSDFKEQNDAIADQQAKLENLFDAVRSAIDSQYGLKDATKDATDAIFSYNLMSLDGARSADELAVAQEDAEKAALKQADAAVRLAEDQAKANGATLDAKAKNDLMAATLDGLAAKMAPGSPARKNLEAYANEFRNFPSSKNATLTVDLVARVTQGVGTLRKQAHGGSFRAGEAMIVGDRFGVGSPSAEAVVFDRPGTVVPRVNMAMGGGGGGGGSLAIAVSVQGSVISERELKAVVADAVIEATRANGRSPLAYRVAPL